MEEVLMLNNNYMITQASLEGMKAAKRVAEELGGCVDFTDILLELDYHSIGSNVYAKSDLSDDVLLTAVSICRRRFKKDDIVFMVVLAHAQEGECGIAFTKDKMYYWEEDEDYRGDVSYMDILDVDYEETVVSVSASGCNQALEIECDNDGKNYSRQMYNFLMDIKEAADKKRKKPMF